VGGAAQGGVEQSERGPRSAPRRPGCGPPDSDAADCAAVAYSRSVARLNPALRVLAVASVTLVVIALVATVGAVTTVRRSFPDRDGRVDVPGLAGPVRVVRDDQGVPQVYADSASDLFLTQGYLHAQDRFFEMDLRRHVTAGRLSELVGRSPDALAADKVIRTLGWRRVAEQELPLLSGSTRQYLQRYADGVNAYLRDRPLPDLALEYTVLDARLPAYRVEPWTPVDSLAWLKAMAWDLKSNYADEVTRARLSAVLPVKRIEQLYPDYPVEQNQPILSEDDLAASTATDATAPAASGASDAGPGAGRSAAGRSSAVGSAAGATAARPGRSALAVAARALDAVPRLVGQGEGIGSNSWVVSGRLTATGKPLLANDPHLAPSVPGVWYQMGLHCSRLSEQCPFDVAGFTFSGMPGVIIGHNQRVAWGFTNLGPDVTDLYLERIVGGRVEYDGRFQDLTTRTETIRVRGGRDVPITVRSTRHGPLLSDVLAPVADAGRDASAPRPDDVTYDVALSWTALAPGRTADAVFAIDQATDWKSFRAAAAQFEVPAQNLVYADVAGNIGYQAPGRVPVRKGYDGRWPVPGWDSRYAWASYVPFQQMPHVLNPSDGFVVTANQAVSAAERPFLTQDWAYGYRAQRIRELLSARPRITAADLAGIQQDTRNEMAPTLVPVLLAMDLSGQAFTGEAQKLLRGWDFSQPPDSAAAAYYNAVWRNLLQLTFDDEFGADLRASGGERWFAVVTKLLTRPSDPWWDNKGTPGVLEGRDEILRQAMVSARVDLTQSLGKDPARWQWGRLHRLELTHTPLGGAGVPGPVRSLVNRGPYELGGGSGSVDATAWAAPDGYQVSAVPSMRMVVDLGDLDRSTWVNLTGASGHPYDAHYLDQVDRWAAGRAFAWPFSPQAVKKAAGDVLELRPAP
jgi:penicillin G amidase